MKFKCILNKLLNQISIYFEYVVVMGEEQILQKFQNLFKFYSKLFLNGSQKFGNICRKFWIQIECNMNHSKWFKRVLKEFCITFKLNLKSNGIWMTNGLIMNGVWMIDELQMYFKLILNISRDHTSSKVPKCLLDAHDITW